MRTIKFRGKKLENGEWLYGDLVQDDRDCCYIYPNDCGGLYANNKVDTDTIGQFTGLLDKNGREIYEGDIIKEDNLVHQIRWIDEASAFCGCHLKEATIRYRISRDVMRYVEVIGNIHDNKELIKGE